VSSEFQQGYTLGQVHLEMQQDTQRFAEWMMNRLRPQADPVQQTIAAWAQQNAELRAEVEALAAENDSFRHALSLADNAIRDTVNVADALKEGLARVQAEASRLQGEVTRLQAEAAKRERLLESTERERLHWLNQAIDF
jgi:peptidoglycan hydrolase CwlO-like protein